MISTEIYAITGISLILLIGVFADKLSDRNSRFPRLIVFILGGTMLGLVSTLIGFKEVFDIFKNASVVRLLAEIALSIVLFREGLELNVKAFRISIRSILILTFGSVIIGSIIFALTITWITSFPFVLTLLIAGILSPTDPVATFSMFRGGIRLKQKEKNIIGSESALNDAVAIVLVTELFLSAFTDGTKLKIGIDIVNAVSIAFFGGIISGYLLGVLFLRLNRSMKFPNQTNLLSLVLVTFSYIIPFILHEYNLPISAPISSLTAGAVFGNPKFFHFARFSKVQLHEFHEQITEIGEIISFGALGLLISPDNILLSLGLALIFALITLVSRIFVVVYILRWPAKLSFKESAFIAWGGMRGLATGVLAIIAYESIISNKDVEESLPVNSQVFMTSILFALIIMSLIQGLTMKHVGRKTKSIILSSRKSDLLIERKIVISKLAFHQRQRDRGELNQNEYRELTIPLRDHLTEIFRELQIENINRTERMNSFVKNLALNNSLIADLGIDDDNIVLKEQFLEIKENEAEVVQKIEQELDYLRIELSSDQTRTIDKKEILNLLVNTKDKLNEICEYSVSKDVKKLIKLIGSIISNNKNPEEITITT